MISSPSIIVSGFCRDKLQINRPLVNHHASRNVSGGLRINGPTFMLADRSENQNHTQSIEAEQRPSLPRDTQLRALRLFVLCDFARNMRLDFHAKPQRKENRKARRKRGRVSRWASPASIISKVMTPAGIYIHIPFCRS